MKKLLLLPLIFSALVVNLGCPTTVENFHDLYGTYWQVTGIQEGDQQVIIPDSIEMTLSFTEVEKVEGVGVCNKYFSDYKVTEDTIDFEGIGSTKIGCGSYSWLETKYFQLLNEASTYSLKESELQVIATSAYISFKPTEKPSEQEGK